MEYKIVFDSETYGRVNYGLRIQLATLGRKLTEREMDVIRNAAELIKFAVEEESARQKSMEVRA